MRLAWVVAVLVGFQLAVAWPGYAAPTYEPGQVWTPPNSPKSKTTPVPTAAVPARPAPPKPKALPQYRAPVVVLPAAGVLDVGLTALVPDLTSPAGERDSRPPVPSPATVRVGESPVWVGPASGSGVTPAAARVTFAGPDVSRRAGVVSGLMLAVSGEAAATAGQRVSVQVDPSALTGLYGGNYAQRLRLVGLPACAMSTPDVADCQAQTPLPTGHDPVTGRLTAQVALPSSGAGLVVAPAAAPAGSAGSYAATSVKPSDQWSAGGATGNFSYAYPVQAPPTLGGAVPGVSLSYSSASVDGLTASTNAQASWVGVGWGFEPGFIERTYQPCSDDGITGSGDTCWAYSGHEVSLGGSGSGGQVVFDDDSHTWHMSTEDGAKIQLLTGANNGAYQGEYWVITQQDGTRYYYGAGHLPTAEGGNGTDPATKSAWTQPVYCPKPADPCYSDSSGTSSFAPAMAYRWNLDFSVDPHGNTIVYNYDTETNYYSRSSARTLTQYVRGGFLKQISYGWRASDVAAQATPAPAAKVVFTTAQRCTGSQTECANVSNLNATTAKDWPDTPFDQICGSTGTCNNGSISYFSTVMLQQIQTSVNTATGYKAVDTYALAHSFPLSGDSSSPSLWLDSIIHTGNDAATAIAQPPVAFVGAMLPNRVPGSLTWPAYNHPRITSIMTETGEQIEVFYTTTTPSVAACDQTAGASVLPSTSNNQMLCYQQYWTPPGQANPNSDWFEKYVVSQVKQTDHITATGWVPSPQRASSYQYLGTPAWHRDDSPTTKNTQRSWNQFRGFGQLATISGVAPDPITRTVETFLRGMDGDYNSQTGGTRKAVTVTDSFGDTVTDANLYADRSLESDTYDHDGGTVQAKSVQLPWSAATASHAEPTPVGLPPETAGFVATGTSSTAELLSTGAWRSTRTVTVHSSTTGLVTTTDNQGDISLLSTDASQETCDSVSYATPPASGPNTGMLNNPARHTSVSVGASGPVGTGACPDPTASNTIADEHIYYDGNTTPGVIGSVGDVTQTSAVDHYDAGGAPVYLTTTVGGGFDAYGRSTSSTDSRGLTTATTYTPATGQLPTGTVVTNTDKGWTTTTTMDQARQQPTTVLDANGNSTSEAYDGLGRLVGVWMPGRSTSQTGSVTYQYKVNGTSAPSTVQTKTLRDDGTYAFAYTILDAYGNPRQDQHVALDGHNGSLVTDTFYDSHGWTVKASGAYPISAFPSTTLHPAADADVPAQATTTYDGQGRPTVSAFYSHAQFQWQTVTAYPGAERTDSTPPTGGTATSSWTDALGRTAALWRYTTPVPDGVPSHAEIISYTYNPAGETSTVTSPGGQVWTYQYDLHGHQTRISDPDTGVSTAAYYSSGDLKTTTDALNRTLAYSYDLEGRKTSQRQDDPDSGPLLAEWRYDTAPGGKGQPAATVTHLPGGIITSTIGGYTNRYAPTGQTITIPAAVLPADEAKLAGTYSTSMTYKPNTGLPLTVSYGADGGLPAETVTRAYDQNGNLLGLSGTADYLTSTTLDPFGRHTLWNLGAMPYQVAQTNVYDEATGRVTEQFLDKETGSSHVDDLTTTWNPAGLVTATQDVQDGTKTDLQCYTYNPLGQLTAAWTDTAGITTAPSPRVPGIGGCNTADPAGTTPAAGTVGGPAPFWQSYTYSPLGTSSGTDNRTRETDHALDGNPAHDVVHNYNYTGATGQTGQPDAVQSVVSSGPNGTHTDSYQYDALGNTTIRNLAGGRQQSFTYNPQNLTATVTDTVSGDTAAYTYDADGSLLLQRDHTATGTTARLYLGAEQISLDINTQNVSGLRYYDTDGGPTEVRSSTGTLTYEFGNEQNTNSVTVDAGSTQAQTRRWFTPYGAPRGPTPSSWIDNRAFLNQPTDPATDLDILGARNYDSATGHFLQHDPLRDIADPSQLGGYTYASNNPVNGADPTGTRTEDQYYGPKGEAAREKQDDTEAQRIANQLNSHRGCARNPDECGHQDPKPTPKPKPKHWWDKAAHWVDDHKAQIAGFAAGAITFAACEAATDGAGSLGCWAAAGAVGNLVTDAVNGNIHSVGDALGSLATGAVQGALAVPLAVVDGVSQIGTIASDVKHGNYMGALGHTALLGLDVATVADGVRGPKEGGGHGGGGCSFAGATLVLLADGTTKPIQNIQIGDQVQSTDTATGTNTAEPVTALHDNQDTDLADITIQDAKGHIAVLHTTAHHRLWNQTTHQWTAAGDLKPRARLRSVNGDVEHVVAVRTWTGLAPMHDLTIAATHTFYVLAGATPVLVHNCGDAAHAPGCKCDTVANYQPHGPDGRFLPWPRVKPPLSHKVRELSQKAGEGAEEGDALGDVATTLAGPAISKWPWLEPVIKGGFIVGGAIRRILQRGD
jgi:RHS repeat-associated protein